MITARVNNLKKLRDNRKKLRNNLTKAEVYLWQEIRNFKLQSRRFRRQHSVGPYVLDFYCTSEKLAIELDGDSHFTENGKEYDLIRDKFLNALGIKVLRIENKVIFEDLDLALKLISDSFLNPL